MMGKTKEYDNGEVTVLWKPDLCIHSGVCVKGLPEVFNPQQRPWIKIDQATSDKIVDQVHKCPTGALSMKANENKIENSHNSSITKINLVENGPLVVMGNLELNNAKGDTFRLKNNTAFCRCGASQKKPFCDGSHTESGFEG